MKPRAIYVGDTRIMAYAKPEVWRDCGPVTVFLHGARRYSELLFHMADIVPGAVFVDLPGHGHSGEIHETPNLTNLARCVRAVVSTAAPNRVRLWVGESLGGLVALTMNREPVIAVDSPISTAKLSNVLLNFRLAWERDGEDTFLANLAWEVFGMSPARCENRHYLSQFQKAHQRATVLTGDMYPSREANRTGVFCLLDEGDLQSLRSVADVVQVPNASHLVLEDAPFLAGETINAARSRLR
jgi:pimeloyl-ACP methyl ester carboxylesterase